MSVISSLFVIGVIIIVGIVSQYIFKKTKIPDALFLMVFGASLSLFGLISGFDKTGTAISFLITISLIYVVFYGALPIRLQALFSTMKYAFLSSLFNVILITGILAIISYCIGFPIFLAISLGALFCVLDGSIINSLLEIIHVDKKAEAQIQSESAITDIFVIVGVLAIISFSKIGVESIVVNLVSYLLLSFIIGVIVAVIWSFLLTIVTKYGSVPIATMAVLILLYAFSEFVHANGIMSVFFFSIVLGNVGIWGSLFYKKQKEHFVMLDTQSKDFFKDISFFIRTFLFVYLGILVDFSNWPYLLIGLAFFIIAFIIREIVMRFVRNKDISSRDHCFMNVMCAKGLTPIALLGILAVDSYFTNIVIGGIFFSVLITSILIFFVERQKYRTIFDYIPKKLFKK